jgi:hypothetical protein
MEVGIGLSAVAATTKRLISLVLGVAIAISGAPRNSLGLDRRSVTVTGQRLRSR